MEKGFRWLSENEEDLIGFTRRMVQTPSLSGEEDKVARVVAEELEKLGYGVEIDEMGSILARIGGGKGKRVLFDGHLDHIMPGDPGTWRHPPYAAEVVDGVMYGRGTVDMKGALAAMIYGCAAPEVEGEVILALVVHEETNEGIATRKLIEEKDLRVDACVLGEPTDLALAIGQRGRAVFRVTTRGATSHSSMPELGENAVYLMTPIIEAIKELNESLPSDPFLGKGTVVVTEISCKPGGGPIVPDRCEVLVDRRTIPGETLEGITEELKELATDAEVELIVDEFTCYTGARERAVQYFAGWLTDEGHWVVERGLEALGAALGERPRVMGWRFSTDGVATAGDLGIPTIGFGPGDPSMAHQPNEHVRVEDVKEAARGFCALAYILTKA